MNEKPGMQVEESKVAYSTALPEQKAFFKIPARFGHVPVAEEPLGYDHERRFEQHYPPVCVRTRTGRRIYGALRAIELPFQLVDTVETGIKKRHEWRAQSLPGRTVRREDAAVSGHRRFRSGTKKLAKETHT